MQAVPVAGGKASLSARGLLWGRMLDPSFIPSAGSALMPAPAPVPVAKAHADNAAQAAQPVRPKPALVKPATSIPTPTPVSARGQQAPAAAQLKGISGILPDPAESKADDVHSNLQLAVVQGRPPFDEAKGQLPAPAPVSTSLTPTERTVHEWLRCEVGVEMCVHVRRGLEGKPAPFTAASLRQLMQDGVFFCELVAVLEARNGARDGIVSAPGLPLTLAGVSARPATPAACLRNINLALGRLRNHPKMPADHLWSAEAVLRGDLDVCWALLTQVWKAYRRPVRSKSRGPAEVGEENHPPPPTRSTAAKASQQAAEHPSLPATGIPVPTHAQPALSRSATAPTTRPAPASARPPAAIAPPAPAPVDVLASAPAPAPAPVTAAAPAPTPAPPLPRAQPRRRRIQPSPACLPRVDFDKIGEAQKGDLRSWLHMIGVSLPRAVEDAHLLDNPLCNGSLLCEVLGVLCPSSLSSALSSCAHPSAAPTTKGGARTTPLAQHLQQQYRGHQHQHQTTVSLRLQQHCGHVRRVHWSPVCLPEARDNVEIAIDTLLFEADSRGTDLGSGYGPTSAGRGLGPSAGASAGVGTGATRGVGARNTPGYGVIGSGSGSTSSVGESADGSGVGMAVVPLVYLWNGEEMLKGNTDLTWALLWHIRDAFPHAHAHAALAQGHSSSGPSHPSSSTLPGTSRTHPPACAPVPLSTNASAAHASHTSAALHASTLSHSWGRGERGEGDGSLSSAASFRSYAALGHPLPLLWRLEQSVLAWMYSLGVLRELIGPGAVPPSLEVLDEHLRSGVLLSLLVPAIGGPHIPGIFHKPSSLHQAVSNITKCCNALRTLPHFSPRFLSCAAAVAVGEREPTLGLLEDCHRHCDGVEPAPFWPDPAQPQLPYFGRHTPPPHPSEHLPPPPPPPPRGHADLLPLSYGSDSTRSARAHSHTHAHSSASTTPPRRLPRGTEAGAGGATHGHAYAHTHPSTSASEQPLNMHTLAPDDLYVLDVSPPAPPPQSRALTFTHAQTQALAQARAADAARLQELEGSGPPSFPGASSSAAAGESTRVTVDGGAVAVEEFVFPDPSSGAAVACQWLRSLGLHLRRPWELLGSRALEFSDGLVLCRLIEVLARGRDGGIVGVEKQPRTAAQKLHNIRKALQVLRDMPAMPTEHLWDEVVIRDADTNVILPLLLQIRKAHGHHLPPVTSTRANNE